MSRKKKEKKISRRSIEYRKFSKIKSEGEADGGLRTVKCKGCDDCSFETYSKNDNLCYGCRQGVDGHIKLAKPRPRGGTND